MLRMVNSGVVRPGTDGACNEWFQSVAGSSLGPAR